ncbi:ATP-dependent DNA helicase, RecQ family [delta proteobacterium NaphS2]|nr:ATP-dependent DNA helicase, RecQ family [delta proteobacterium NaphS2]
MTSLSELLNRTLMLDLETTRSGRIRHIGAILNDQIFEKKERAGSKVTLRQLEAFAGDAEFILGHNLLGHDFPLLQSAYPRLKLLRKPVIDTLYLSPIAFPQNPYHRLVKDYKLVRATINNPLEDAKLAGSVFKDQWESFKGLSAETPEVIDFYRYCFHESVLNGFSGNGLSEVFSLLASEVMEDPTGALQCFIKQTSGKVCIHAVNRTISDLLADNTRRPAAAFVLAWFQVVGGNSVLPPWVRYRFPEIPAVIRGLRGIPCGDDECGYCAENHDPERQLERLFGHTSFRETPQTEEGESLQRAIVVGCLGDQPTLGILPTGGGKSLCYQLPALVRYRRRGTLTVVISPLQALMKDQVDNLVKKTGTMFAESVSGLQTPPERGAVFERIRLGDTAILYISPEQLRSIGVRNVLKQREIGAWIFDEAHCLSKWGHDFRPDYLYAARFIREFSEEQGQPVPPVSCFTATAKTGVIEEIKTHFREELGQELQLYEGGVERQNLSFEVIPLSKAEKLERTHEIIQEHLDAHDDPGGIIVYAATRAATEEIRDFLLHQGVVAEAFHAGIDPKDKREIIEAFVEGLIPVICATNAFGMGIDKENIRLVLHFNMPGSLENYIQEAGRAGRDLKPSRCILLYDPEDATLQFQMGSMSEVRRKEISRTLRALRRKKKDKKGEIVVTTDELIRDEDWADMKDLKPEFRDTRIRASVAWLERAGFLKRNHNLTEVFQGKLLVESLDEAGVLMDRLNISHQTESLWRSILQQIINSPKERGIRADELAEVLFPEKDVLQAIERQTGQTAAQIVISSLHDMADAGLIDQGLMLSASFRPKGKNNARKTLQTICGLEKKLISLMRTEDPDVENGDWVLLDIRRLNQRLTNEELQTSPDILRLLIKGISHDGKGFAASTGSFEIGHVDRNRYRVRLKRSWESIGKTVSLRQQVAGAILKKLVELVDKQAVKTGTEITGDVRIDFTSDELSAAIKGDLTISVEVKKVLPAIERGLMFLHEQHVIELQGGLAVLRQAMTLRLARTAKGRYFNKGDYKPLDVHYREKRLQVHVMMRYATLALEKVARALTLVLDYFALGRVKFINKYFEGDEALLEKAITAESFRTIVENLRNPVQIGAVGRPVDDSMLILAGPGSGKTTVIVHRCAYLLEVERVPARHILVLCFNHSSAMVLKKRLRALVGKAANAVTVATYHGVAMRLAGISIRDMAGEHSTDNIAFDRIIKDAVRLLKGEKDVPGTEPDEHRDRLLAGYSHILVDEYQDIDEDQYDLVSAIAGRSVTEADNRLNIMAVGDDDQNIYTFRGANVRFIRRFRTDYSREVVYLVENYRSSKNIISAANALIRANRDRMKTDHPITVNHERQYNAPGGRWERIDPVSRGRVQMVSVENPSHQADYVKDEIDRLMALDPNLTLADFAVLSRTRVPLANVRSVLEESGYPIRTVLEKGFPFHRVREIYTVLEWLGAKEKDNRRASELMEEALKEIRPHGHPNIWWQLIDLFFENHRDETSDSTLPVSHAIDQFHEFMAEQRREKVLGQGIFLSTIHSSKGMEFPHVMILDGDWGGPASRAEWEEERRVMYVGMTRAKETLCLMQIPGRPNPFLKEIRGDFVVKKSYKEGLIENEFQNRQYELIGLNEIYMDFAGCFHKGHGIHNRLASLETGQRVLFHRAEQGIEIHDMDGRCVGRLSKEGADRWSRRLSRICELRVVALLRRDRHDPEEVFQNRIKVDQWELPVLEAVHSH